MKKISLCSLLLFVLCAAPRAKAVDVDASAAIPVFNRGRVKPLQTFAREAADAIYDRRNKVRLSLEGYIDQEQLANDPKYAGILDLFPEGEARSFDPTELVLSWLIEPEKWERVPFIHAPHEDLRNVLGVKSERGLLKYVSPHDVLQSDSLREYLSDLHDRQTASEAGGEEFVPTTTDEMVQELLERYNRWRALAFDPRRPLTLSQVAEPGTRGRFVRQITNAIEVVNQPNAQGESLAGRLEMLASAFGRNPEEPLSRAIVGTLTSLDQLRAIGQKLVQQFSGAGSADVTLEDARTAVVGFRASSKLLADQLTEQKSRIFEESGSLSSSQAKVFRPMFREIASKADELHRLSVEMHAALYDEGESLLVSPALNPYALAKHRDTENMSQPWLSLQAVLYSDELVADYPQGRIDEVRESWADLAAVFQDRANEDRGERLEQAQANFAAALRGLGEAVEPARRKAVEKALPAGEQDDVLMAYTAYPPQWKVDTEVQYNNVNPFQWSWVLSMLAVACFALAFGAAKKPMFWTGVVLMAVCAAWTAYGFSLRILVTGWAPVTNMYETVVYVPWVMLLLGLWFLLLPLNWTGIRNAWRATAIPVTWEASELDDRQRCVLGPKGWNALGWAIQPFRFALMAGLFVLLSVMDLGHGGRPYFPLLPNLSDVAGASGIATSLGVWVVGWVCLLLTVWFGPRFILTTVLSIIFIPISWRERGAFARMAKDVYPRKVFGGAASLGAWFFLILASYAPVLDESFQPLQPVLRSNFWLTIHVLTIVASYGAGMLAWGLGCIGLFHLMFGKYRDPAVPANLPEGMKPADSAELMKASNRRPPEAVGVLANYAYRAIQVAVLLLAAGTILGGLWADVSWGTILGLGPEKEVFALISLLVYLAVLHGRFAGWFNHFGLIFGTVLGATMIAGSWYGVNFGLPMIAKGSVGLHSYGEGSGGQMYVLGFVVLNWVVLGIATIRYRAETSVVTQPLENAETSVPAELIEH